MNQLAFPIRLLVYFRFMRPAIDMLLLAVLIGGFAFLHTQNNEHEKIRLNKPVNDMAGNSSTSSKIPQKTQQEPKPLFLTSNHDAEEALWTAWANWLRTEKPMTGNCLVEPRGEADEIRFHLLCFGTADDRFVPVLSKDEMLFSEGIFSLPKPSTSRTKKKVSTAEIQAPEVLDTPETPETPPYTSRGWIDTPQGRKHFNPTTGKWMP